MANILIADDDRDVLLFITDVLLYAGHKAYMANDGISALNMFNDGLDVDLLIADIQMPGLAGQELVAKVRSIPRYHNLPLILVSGRCNVNGVAEILAMGNAAFLGKPLRLLMLERAVEDALNCWGMPKAISRTGDYHE